ncbi:YdeI/OmpD-associated family protein [Lactobacillus sp. DCY120]|uniref:YdeI/OmpD-associated family protein n=1 Tax=Bombilactobacillus apium TaxID=2675299 RepID=A0A850R5M3_9LACO|nr:YdeI/OmpD-associated family protein [Bombilactobacillus apium]NVY95912.1 YdeI/OmpD-associated family protein [Bombilactobacillus apium]
MSIQDPQNLLNVTSRNEFRKWLTENYTQTQECWVMVKRGIPQTDTNFWYIDAVEEAMCFGWIDSTYKVIIPSKPAFQRFVPRKQGSIWSELNKARCIRMEKQGRMTAAGKARLPDMNPNSFRMDKRIKRALKRRPGAREYFCECPPLYQRVRIDTIQIKANNAKLFRKRMTKFANACRDHKMIGQWSDGGRLNDIYINVWADP